MWMEVTSCCQVSIPQTNVNRDLTLLDQGDLLFFAASSATKNTYLKRCGKSILSLLHDISNCCVHSVFYSDVITVWSRHVMNLIPRKHRNRIKCFHFRTIFFFQICRKANIISCFSRTLTIFR